MTTWRPSPSNVPEWVPWVRVLAAPFALADAAAEEFPPGHEAWAWALAGTFAAGAAALFAVRRVPPAAGLTFDLAIVSGLVSLYGFEPNSPVRLLFVLTAVEAALFLGRRGALLAALASAPALAIFEWRTAERLDEPLDAGHILGPIGIQVAVGLAVATLARRGRAG